AAGIVGGSYGQSSGIERDVVVGDQARGITQRASDRVGADESRGCVAGTAVDAGQVFAINAGVDRGPQVGGQNGSGAVHVAVIADLVGEGFGRGVAGAARSGGQAVVA